MKITILSHHLSSNAAMRAHRLAVAARHFATVSMIGPVKPRGPWPVLPVEPWIRGIPTRNFPKFFGAFRELVAAADGDVLIAVKPFLTSFWVALIAGETRNVPVILDLDDLDIALAPRSAWALDPKMADLRNPASAVYLSVLTRATGAAAAVTVASRALQARFGGTLIPHGCLTELFDPAQISREKARDMFGFSGPTVLFPGTPRLHKGIKALAKAVARVPGARLAVTCRPEDLRKPEWRNLPVDRLPLVPYDELPRLLAAADVVAIPQLDTTEGSYQMPMKVYDAMAMAKPIVATTISDLPLALDGCARLVPPGDSRALAQAITELLTNPEEARLLGEKARRRCLDHFTMAQVSKQLLAVIQSVYPSH